MTPHVRGQDGVSLLEVLIAMVLVAVAVLAVVRDISTSEGTTARASSTQVAVATASASLEQLRSLPYDSVALAPPAEPPSRDGAGARVLARVTATPAGDPGYRVPDGPVEALVDEDPGSPLPAFERLGATVAGTPVRLRVYRFVSWRDEECPVADPSELEAALGDLRAALAGAERTLAGLSGKDGTLLAALRDGEALLGTPVPEPLRTAATGAVQTGVGPLDALVRPQLAPVREALASAEALVDPVTGRVRDTIDLCDAPPEAVPSLGDLAAARAALAAVDPAVAASAPAAAATADVLAALAAGAPPDPAALAAHAADLTARTTELLGHVAAVGAALEGLRDREERRATLRGLLEEVRDSLRALRRFLDEPETERNSKRISVAVVVDSPLGPRAPVWASSVVTDPEDGLL